IFQDNPKVTLRVSRTDTAIVVTALFVNGAKTECEISPAQGYSVVRLTAWLPNEPALPFKEVRTTYRQIKDGPFVAVKQRGISRGLRPLVVMTTWDVTLDDIELGTQPDAKQFTLEGLGLPRGGRVQ